MSLVKIVWVLLMIWTKTQLKTHHDAGVNERRQDSKDPSRKSTERVEFTEQDNDLLARKLAEVTEEGSVNWDKVATEVFNQERERRFGMGESTIRNRPMQLVDSCSAGTAISRIEAALPEPLVSCFPRQKTNFLNKLPMGIGNRM